MHPLRGLLVHTPHELKQQTLFHNLMPVDSRRDTLDQSSINMIRLDHALKFLKFRLSKGFSKGQAIPFSIFLFTPNVRGAL